VVLCVLCLGRDLGVIFLPYREHVEEGGGCEEGVGRVAGAVSTIELQCFVSNILGGLVVCHVPVALFECGKGKLLAVGARGYIVEDGVFAGVLGLCLLQLLHEVGRVGGAFCVGGVEASGNDLLDHVEAYCGC